MQSNRPRGSACARPRRDTGVRAEDRPGRGPDTEPGLGLVELADRERPPRIRIPASLERPRPRTSSTVAVRDMVSGTRAPRPPAGGFVLPAAGRSRE